MTWKTTTWFLCILLVLTLSGNCFSKVSAADPETPDLSVEAGHPYYLHGETASIITTGPASTSYVLTILDPEDQTILQRNRATDSNGKDTFAFTVPVTFPYGFYTIKAAMTGAEATSYVTLLNVEGLTAQSFPFTKKHMGINYSITVKGFTAETSENRLTVTYPSLPVAFTVNAYSNDMILVERLRNTGLGITIDLTYAFIHSGVKIIINGSVPQATTYTFKFSSPNRVLNMLDSIRDGSLVFDWSDLKKAAQAFTYDQPTQTVTVSIPRTFNIDPYVFSDGFESDFGAWTGTSGAPVVAGNVVHHGSKSAEFNATEYCYKTLPSSQAVLYHRFYARVTDLPNVNGEEYDFARGYAGGTAIFEPGLYFTGGQLCWKLMYRNGAAWTSAIVVGTVVVDRYYCLEVYWKLGAADGEVHLFIDGVDVVNVTGKDTDDFGNCDRIRNGISSLTGVALTIYEDCVVVDSSYIGPEATNTAPTIGSFAAPSTVYANKYEFFNVTVNDVDLKTDLRNVTVQLNGSAQFTWLNSTGVFSEASDPSNYFTLDAANSVKIDVNTTAVTLSWKLKPYWNYSEGSVNANGTVYDASNASGTGSKTGMFTFEDDLIISSVTHLPGQPAAGQQITLTGQIYYEGTATAPEDSTGITAYAVRNNTATQVGSTSTFTAGAFSMSWQEGTDGTYGYDVYCVTDEASTQNRTEIIYVEKIITGQLPHDIIIPNKPNDNSTDNSGSSDLGPGWALPVGFNLAAPILIFSCLVAIVSYDGYEKDFKLSGTSKSWSKHKGKSRKMGGLFSKRKTDKKTEWKEKKPWD